MESALRRLRARVKHEGLKASEVREAIARTALSIKGHFTGDELLGQLPSLHSSTVYRVLPVLVDSGLLQEAPGQGDGQRYERAFEREHHGYLLCKHCGRVIEFHFETIDHLERDVAQRFNFALTSHVHHLYGRCSKCQRPGRVLGCLRQRGPAHRRLRHSKQRAARQLVPTEAR